MKTKEGFTGVILAGGRSSRMGRDKAQLRRVDKTMLQFTQQQLFLAGAERVVISKGFDAANPNQKDELADVEQDLGPLGGIHSVIQSQPQHHYLFVPVDLPFLNVTALKRLVDVGLHGRQSTSYFRQPLPLFFYWQDNCAEQLTKIIEDKSNLSIRHFASQISTLKLNTHAQHDWFNANTPEDWQQALARL